MERLESLANMVYSGRGIITGRTPSGDMFIGYSLTGRSDPSRARKLVFENDGKEARIRTEVTDKAQLEKGNPALLLYPAVVAVGHFLVASNGAQTRLIVKHVKDTNYSSTPGYTAEFTLSDALAKPCYEKDNDGNLIDITSFEPDGPNFTPRISAAINGSFAAMHSIRRVGESRNVWTEKFLLYPGKCSIITTYHGGNESPLWPYVGDLMKEDIRWNDPQEIAEVIYNSIRGGAKPEDNYRVAAAVMLKDTKTGEIRTSIINRIDRGE